MINIRASFVRLIIAATASTAIAAGPIDTKTEHLGFRLGSSRSELKAKVLEMRDAHNTAHHPWQFTKPPPEMREMERYWQTVEIKPQANATFGGVPLDTVTLGYLCDHLCIMWLHFPLPAEAEGMSEHDQRIRMDAMVEGLAQKYGPVSSPTPSASETQPNYKMPVMWEGDDIVCHSDIISQFTVTLMSKAALKAAEEDAIHRIHGEEQQTKKRAKEVSDDL